MSQLTELDASCNQLTHLPPRMGELHSLRSLILRSNLLLCVPIEVTCLGLARLDLRANRITVLPVEMLNIATLVELLVEDNPLTSPPASVSYHFRKKNAENDKARSESGTSQPISPQAIDQNVFFIGKSNIIES